MKKKVVLAFSGGLDTSYCAKYLAAEKNLDVYSVLVDTGGFSDAELTRIKQRAEVLGVKKHITIDAVEDYYHSCIRFLLYGNVLKNGTYPLSVSAERVFQALAIARYASEIEADFIAHGSTGAGNDQVRFDIIFNIINPEMKILTPIRDNKLSRQEEIGYLSRQGIILDGNEALYSINKGLWGTSVGGKETLTSDQDLPDQAFPTAVTATQAKELKLIFDEGQFAGFDRQRYQSPAEAIRALNRLAAGFGVGRDIHIGDTIIGIKGRVGFEAPAPILLIKAHQALEKHTLAKWQIYWKDQLSTWYGMMLHEGQFLDPVMRDIEVFLENTQKTVSGTVCVHLAPRYFHIKGIQSRHDLMSPDFGAYGEKNLAWHGDDVRGFAKILSNQTRIYRAVNKDDER